jgi:hypothetical protein
VSNAAEQLYDHATQAVPSLRRLSAAALVSVALGSFALGISGSGAPTLLASCNDAAFVYDPHIDEVIPVDMVGGLESAVPPVQPGDKLTHHFRPWQVFCVRERRSG